MDINVITYLACICFLFLFGRIFIVPVKKVLKLILNSILGGVAIYVINLIGSVFNFHIGLNFYTSILIRTVGFARSSLFDYYQVVSWIMPKGTSLFGRLFMILHLEEWIY